MRRFTASIVSCAREAEMYLKERFRSPMSAISIADQLSCPASFLCRTFKQLTGKSLLEYQSEVRLRRPGAPVVHAAGIPPGAEK